MMEKGPALMCAGRAEDNLSSGQNKTGSDGSFERLKTNLGPSIKSIKTQMNKFSNLPKTSIMTRSGCRRSSTSRNRNHSLQLYTKTTAIYRNWKN